MKTTCLIKQNERNILNFLGYIFRLKWSEQFEICMMF